MHPSTRASAFCRQFGLTVPVLQAPMSGTSPPGLAVAVAAGGGMGACGALRDSPQAITEWVAQFRRDGGGPLQLNTWVPLPAPARETGEPAGADPARARGVRAAQEFLSRFGAAAAPPAGSPPDVEAQVEAMLTARPTVISSMMGLLRPGHVQRLHRDGIAWFACVTTLDEALAAEAAGADAVVAQSAEAGGHRGTFDQAAAERTAVGMFALLPRLADRLRVPVVAAGGIADGRGLAAALSLGASAVQIGTALLRTPEAGISAGWDAALADLAPEDTVTTRAYTGRLARAAPSEFLTAWTRPGTPPPAPFPEQSALVAAVRAGGGGTLEPENRWAGQNAALARRVPASEVVRSMWTEAREILSPPHP